MVPQVYLIRHGETEWSLAGRHTGRTEIPLTARGEAEARELGERLRCAGIARVLTSPRLRARRTCELAGLAPAAETEPDLAEWDYGDCEGKTSAEILAAQPGWDLFRDGCPGGETPAQVADRADALIRRLRARDEAGSVALFTHGHFGRVLGMRWIEMPVSAARLFALGTASVSILGFAHGSAGEPVVVRWNSAAPEMSAPGPAGAGGEPGALKQRAIQRWENEGGEIPGAARGP
jgi:probable phosphoglycerate mutase